MEKNEIYYGVLMNRVIIDAGIYLYKPMYLIEGTLEKEEDNLFFVDVSGNTYLTTNDSETLSTDEELSVAYCISLENLEKQYPGLSVLGAKEEYFDSICATSHIGFYLVSCDTIALLPYPFFDIAEKLNNLKLDPKNGNIAIPMSELFGENVSDNSSDILSEMLEKNNGEDLVVITVDQLENILRSKNFEEMKGKLNTIYQSVEEMNSHFQDTKENASTITNGKNIVSLFNESYDSLLNFTDMDEIKHVISELVDFYTECSLRLDEKNQTDAILAAQDFLYRLVDEWESIGACDTLEEMHKKLIKLKEAEQPNIVKLAHIYDEARDTVREESVPVKEENSTINVKEIKKFFDEKIIGQEEAKKDVIQSIVMNGLSENPSDRNSVLLVGPTGSGKTLIAETVSEYLDIPMEVIDTTQLTSPGYIGANIEDFLARLITKTSGDVKKAEKGIVVFDEIDKKGSDKNSDISGKGVLNTLLPFIQGTTYDVKVGYNKTVPFNTANLTIFATGAFTDVNEAKGLDKGNNIGFGSHSFEKTNNEDIKYEKIDIDDLVKYGGMPRELIGRFSTITQLSGHTKESLIKILTGSNASALIAEQKKLSKLGINLRWTNGYIETVADRALTLKTGARSLKATVEKSIKEARWEVLENLGEYSSIILTEKTVANNRDCELINQNGNSYKLETILANKEKEQYVEAITVPKVKQMIQ